MIIKSHQSSLNLSLCGCGFLGVYHIGVVCAFKEHAPEILHNKMAGCSAGALVAACAMSDCCLGQMCSDALEIAIRARSRTLGPLHPTFNIVDIIRNGLRRILPPNAHELCSGRLFISLTRWKDNKNVIINEFHTREELIQVLLCSSFVPYWSGIIPEKFRSEYYWDGGLTNNNPIIDENTILVSPFAGESDICPRDESGSFFSVDIQGTDISCTQENLYRATRALFPPDLFALKQICWRGYIDGLKFLQTRNMIRSSHLTPKVTISSVLGNNYTEPDPNDEQEIGDGGIGHNVSKMYEEPSNRATLSGEESQNVSVQKENTIFCRTTMRKKELPTPVFAVFAQARQKLEYPIGRYFMESKIFKAWSFLTLPITIPIDLTCAAVKRAFGYLHLSSITHQSSNRVIKLIRSIFCENDDTYCYHVQDCQCTNRLQFPNSSFEYDRSHSFSRIYQRQVSAPASAHTSIINGQDDISTVHTRSDGSVLSEDIFQCDTMQSIVHEEFCKCFQEMTESFYQQQCDEESLPLVHDDQHSTKDDSAGLSKQSIEQTLFLH